MPNIKSNTYLCENYNELSSFCHKTGEPIIITKNGQEDLAVMSIDLFNKFMGRYELYQLLEQSESDFTNCRTHTFDDSMRNLREELKKYFND
ncbi:type II toxin-antitoxin system prevent-host-death family antitoxin [Gemella sp. 27098_8_149]|uniref:type II toxin-antitoxin system prevent-host-death family antitoxin n=1 Tax=Gemella sp. 27098_8_149 TaxID=3003689 RepID=UPI0025D0FFCA|nr:type II toxin-antitoxin system prevent-host-death family antitoxin [uncultured Gemella sp.]